MVVGWPAAVVFLGDGAAWEVPVLCGLGMGLKREFCVPRVRAGATSCWPWGKEGRQTPYTGGQSGIFEEACK